MSNETEAATEYVTSLFPPLPEAYGPWLVELARQAKSGTHPDTPLPVPGDVQQTGTVPPAAHQDSEGTLVITLHDALKALRQEELLYADDEEQTDPPLEIITPVVALALANTADARYWGETYDPERITYLADRLANGEWAVDMEAPVHVDEQGRITSCLNELLAIVLADAEAPLPTRYAYDDAPRPLGWRGPASGRGINGGRP